MGIFSRLTDIINANLNALLDRAEDPEKMIGLIIQEMEDTLVEVRSSTVKIIAEKKELERKIATHRRQRDEWSRKAETALGHDREDLARAALKEKARSDQAAEKLLGELAPIEESLAKSGEDIAHLQAKIADARAREQAMAARRQSAVNRVKVREKLNDTRIEQAFARYEQVERNLDELEGRAEVYDLVAPPTARKKSLAEEINELDAEDKIDRELRDLKAKIARPTRENA